LLRKALSLGLPSPVRLTDPDYLNVLVGAGYLAPPLLPELVRAAADPTRPVPGRQAPGHVALSACDEWEVANESVFPDGVHGVFSARLWWWTRSGNSWRNLWDETPLRLLTSRERATWGGG
jgi:hypothetical protein